MKTLKTKILTSLMLTVFISSLVITGFAASVKAETNNPTTVALWHLNEVDAAGDSAVTPDAAGGNGGILGGPTNPASVSGQFDKAMSFSGTNFVYVPISFLVGFPPTAQPIYIPISNNLNVQTQVKLDAWINVQAYTNESYNNVLIKCTRSDAEVYNTTRVLGLAIRGSATSEDPVPITPGILSGFVMTDNGVYNEIVTTQTVINASEWVHVTFTYTSTGMHLYLNGYEQQVQAIHGLKNPTGKIMNGTEVYIGHGSNMTIDEASITDLNPPDQDPVTNSVDIGPNILIATIAVALILAVAWLLRRAIQMRVIHSRSS
jgi:hypothetical protein